MWGFNDDEQKRKIDFLSEKLREIRREINSMQAEISSLKHENEITIGQPSILMASRDTRPRASVKEVLMLILKEIGLELTHTKAYEKVDLVRPVKAKSK